VWQDPTIAALNCGLCRLAALQRYGAHGRNLLEKGQSALREAREVVNVREDPAERRGAATRVR
jgi:hypothetical protein